MALVLLMFNLGVLKMIYRTFTPSESYVLPDEGTHAAVVSGVAFLGQHQRNFMEKSEIVDLIGIQYQLASNEDGQAAYVTEELPLRTSPKSNLVKRLRAILGKDPELGFRYVDLLGKPCVVTVEHREWNDMSFANVGAVSSPNEGAQDHRASQRRNLLRSVRARGCQRLTEEVAKEGRGAVGYAWPTKGFGDEPQGVWFCAVGSNRGNQRRRHTVLIGTNKKRR
jgi:hypothetical protein